MKFVQMDFPDCIKIEEINKLFNHAPVSLLINLAFINPRCTWQQI
jgi:hypothetical protein